MLGWNPGQPSPKWKLPCLTATWSSSAHSACGIEHHSPYGIPAGPTGPWLLLSLGPALLFLCAFLFLPLTSLQNFELGPLVFPFRHCPRGELNVCPPQHGASVRSPPTLPRLLPPINTKAALFRAGNLAGDGLDSCPRMLHISEMAPSSAWPVGCACNGTRCVGQREN